MVRPAARGGGSSASVSLRVLGGFELRLGDRVAVVQMTVKRLLAFLALHPRPLARSYVSQSLWLEATERHANGNLRSALWKVARSDVALIDSIGDQVALASTVSVDLHRSIALAEKLMDDASAIDGSELDERALRDELLPDWCDEWVLVERERYRQLRLHALECLCQRLISLGSFGHAVQAGLAAVAAEPLRESANLALIRAHVAEGNASEAIRHYLSYRDFLQAELGTRPPESMTRFVMMARQR